MLLRLVRELAREKQIHSSLPWKWLARRRDCGRTAGRFEWLDRGLVSVEGRWCGLNCQGVNRAANPKPESVAIFVPLHTHPVVKIVTVHGKGSIMSDFVGC